MFDKQAHLFHAGLELGRMETGHYLHREQPQEFARRVTAFLKADRALP
jgi:pimeloyl-ACP methyl ester carboxylesterase